MTPAWIEHGAGDDVVVLLDGHGSDAIAQGLAFEHRVLLVHLDAPTAEAKRDEVLALVAGLDLDRIDIVGPADVVHLVAAARPGLVRRLVAEDASLDVLVPLLNPHALLNGPERDILESFLDRGRELVLRSLRGLTQEQATALPIPSCDLSVAGVVKHLARVEDMWFHERFALQPAPEPWASMPDEPDWDFHSARADTIADVRALYLAACDRSRAVAARFELDDETTRVSFGKGTPSLRRIFLHVHHETAQHLGHLDLLRDATLGR